MNYNFYANKEDKLEIFEFIFKETDLHIYDLSSAHEQQICQYKTVEEISSKFDLVNGDKFATTFQLWSPRHKGNLFLGKSILTQNVAMGILIVIQRMDGD
ncbi:MAG: hypothetical protein IPL12_04500 [Bacteroidetes bacterium]|nr:hypothetical protein [Bacteroidota bacterium]